MENELSKYTTKELYAEIYKRTRKPGKTLKEKKTCFHCKNRVSFMEATRLERKGALRYELNHMGYSSICLEKRDEHNQREHLCVNNRTPGCELYEERTKKQ